MPTTTDRQPGITDQDQPSTEGDLAVITKPGSDGAGIDLHIPEIMPREPDRLPVKMTPATVLMRSLGSTAKAARLALRNQDLDPDAKAVIDELVASVHELASLVTYLLESVEGQDAEIQRLRQNTSTLVHRVELATTLMEEMKTVARKDALTGALNRLALNEAGPKIFERMREDGQPFSYIFLDLDFFKIVNDAFGNPVGDKVLQEFVKLVQDLTRLSDFTFRHGGDEFCLLLPETNLAGATILAERIRDAVENYTFDIGGKQFRITTSVGVAEADFDNGDGFAGLEERAVRAKMRAHETRNTAVGLSKDNAFSYPSPENRYVPDPEDTYGRYKGDIDTKSGIITRVKV